MNRTACLLLALSSAAPLGGCSSRTEIVLGAATDLRARNQIDEARLLVTRNGQPLLPPTVWSLTDQPAGVFELPGSFGLYSPDGSEVHVDIALQGWRSGALVIERDSSLALVPGATLFTRLALVSDCTALDGPSCANGQGCVEGVCRAETVDAHTFPKFQRGIETKLQCQSGFDYVVSSSGVAMPLLGSSATCPSGQRCQEGTCYRDTSSGPDAGALDTAWVDTMPPATSLLHAVWQTPDGQDAFAVGDAGTILHLHAGGAATDSGWVAEKSPLPANLYAVWGTSVDDVTVAGTYLGAGGIILHRSMGVWTQVQAVPPSASLRALGGSSAGDLWLVGAVDAKTPLVLHGTGGTFSRDATFDAALAAQPSLAATQLRAVSVAPGGEVWVAGAGGVLGYYDGASWALQRVQSGAAQPPDLRAVVALDGGEARVAGQGGFLARVTGGGFVTIESGPLKVDLYGLAARGVDELVAVGDYGTILRWNGVGWAREGSGTTRPLFAVWAGATSLRELAVGSEGTVLLFGSQGAVDGGVDASAPPCRADADCAVGSYCNGSASCAPRRNRGGACDVADHPGGAGAASSCAQPGGCGGCALDSFCTDGVCCDQSPSQCSGCQACNLLGHVGGCAPVLVGDDPHGTCANVTAECQQTSCNGSGSCDKSGGACGQPDCAAGMLTSHTCNQGACVPVTPASQCPVVLACADAHDCANKCAADTECDASSYCDKSGNCSPRKDANAQGTCNFATDCKDPASCRECKAGLTCVDGYCCTAAACGGICQSCGNAGKQGTCSPAPSGSTGLHGSCAGKGTSCAESCDGTTTAACKDPLANTTCGAASCSGNVPLSAQLCGGGACKAGTAGTSCTTSSKICKTGACTTCAANADCTAAGYSATNIECAVGAGTNNSKLCLLRNGQSCGANNALCASGQCVDGFCCKSSSCAGACEACGASGDCAPLPAATAPNTHSGGCPSTNASCKVLACDGVSRTCNYPTGSCGAASCSGDAPVSAPHCASGACIGATTQASCSPYGCSGGTCNTTCSSGGAGCATDAMCFNIGGDGPAHFVCEKDQGAQCTTATQCRTGNCAQGVCCDTSCIVFCDASTNRLYQAPSCATGTCTPGGASAPCPNNLTCDGTDQCSTTCETVWIPSTGLYTSECIAADPFCCQPAAVGGNCQNTKCCTALPCN